VDDGTVPDERMEAWIAGEHLPRRARRRVPLEDDADVFA
jgi:hypothetical protein